MRNEFGRKITPREAMMLAIEEREEEVKEGCGGVLVVCVGWRLKGWRKREIERMEKYGGTRTQELIKIFYILLCSFFVTLFFSHINRFCSI